jgi:hypothetical protein
MAQIFHRSFNTIAKVSAFGAVLFGAALVWVVLEVNRSSYVTEAMVPRDQPVMFSHKHHVLAVGLDCRYCHTSVETSSFAGIPPVETCMTCHSQIWADAPMLEPVRESWRSGKGLEWVRVHDLPDFVYFNHSIHVKKGIGCESCHGAVDQMPMTWKTESLQMEWCLACHREPERHVRPREEVFATGWQPPEGQEAIGKRLVEEYKIQKLTNCSVCHR